MRQLAVTDNNMKNENKHLQQYLEVIKRKEKKAIQIPELRTRDK